MNGTLHPYDMTNDSEAMDPSDAVRLLERTRRQAERDLNFDSPWLTLVAAVAVLAGFGAVWLSVRHQHPFKGPTAAGLSVLYALVAIRLATVAIAARRATTGVTGRSPERRRAEAAAAVGALLAAYLLMGALAHAGLNHPVVYWMYGVTATLIVLGAFWAGRSATCEDWPALAVSIAVALVAAGSALAGPRGMWLSDGIGLCVVLLAYTALQARLIRTPRSAT
ncbi:MAG: hypothetical protein ACRDL5_19215 [Solirubrobacteraceae bacterium]